MNIKLEQVDYIYNPGTAGEKCAVRDVSLMIGDHEFIALAGNTGSGKSTLVQLINGLKLPSSGRILYDGKNISDNKKELCKMRCRVGLVFQYPEYQLFDETVLKDVTFGPKNMGCSGEEAEKKAREALLKVGLGEDKFDSSPFDLSGGEKRRAAIAGIIAMDPEVLIMDEPTAGLDPAGKKQILDLLKDFNRQYGKTVIMITHNMDEAAEYADRVIIMKDGSIAADGETHEIFRDVEMLADAGLKLPQAASFCRSIGINHAVRVREAVRAILEMKRYTKDQ